MKRLSIILSAVLMTIFFTACSSGTPVEINEDRAIAFVKDQTSGIDENFLSLKQSLLTVTSDEGVQQLSFQEKYNLNEYDSCSIRLEGNEYSLTPLTGFLKSNGQIIPVCGAAFDTCMRTLTIISIPGSKCEVISSGHLTFEYTKGEKIPFMYVAYMENGAKNMIYVPVLRPEKRFPTPEKDNLLEQYFSGKLKCARVL